MKTKMQAMMVIFQGYTLSQEFVTDFATRLSSDPLNAHYELRWADSVVVAAAEARVMAEIITYTWRRENTDNEMTVEMIHETALAMVLSMARSTSRSTSPMANLVEDATLAAWAKVVQACD